jgi:formate dehydrogenase assembly factor FdhD
MRRHEVEGTYVYIRIFYNDKEVTRTIPRPIDLERFTVPFKGLEALPVESDSIIDTDEAANRKREEWTTFGIKVREVPESLRVEVYETVCCTLIFRGNVLNVIPGRTW